MKQKILSRLIAFLGFISVFLVLLKPPLDPDLFWHLKNGEIMAKERRFLFFDEYSHTLTGYPWADSYWLSEVLLSIGNRLIGLWGLVLFFTLLATLALFLQVKTTRLLALTLVFLSGIIIIPFIGVRPQVISLFLFSLLLKLLRRFSLSFVPLLFLLWANLHAGFVLGLLLLWLFTLKEWWFSPRSRRRKRWLLVSGASTLAPLINPYGLTLFLPILNDAASYEIKAKILEWHSVDFHSLAGLLFLLFLIILLTGWLFFRRGEAGGKLFVIAPFIILALLAVRNVALLVVLALPDLIKIYGEVRIPAFFRFYRYLALLFFLIFPWSFGFEVIPRTHLASVNEEKLAEAGNYPRKAVEYLKTNPQSGNVFNAYGWGGYLIYNLPGTSVFIDGRMPGWPEILADYLGAYYLTQDFEEIFLKYQIHWVLVEKEAPITRALKVHPQWGLEYEDEVAMIFRRLRAE